MTIDVVGAPIIVVWTDTGTPSTVPGVPEQAAVLRRPAGTPSRPPSKRAAIRVARLGSPGSRTTGA